MKHFSARILIAAAIAAIASFLLFTYGVDLVHRLACPVLFDICVYQGNLLLEIIYNLFLAVSVIIYAASLRYIAKLPLTVAVFTAVASFLAESILSPFIAKIPLEPMAMQLIFVIAGACLLAFHATILKTLFDKKPSLAPFIGATVWLVYGFILWVIVPSL